MIQEEYNPEAVEAFAKAGKAIPGQSLTSNPDEPRPFESPPEFTNFKEALDYTVGELLEEDAYMSIVGAIGDGVPIVDLVMQITYVGFREGKWNPDLMMILAEPLCYMLLALAEKADIDPVIYSGEDDDEDENPEMFNVEMQKDKFEKLSAAARKKTIPAGVIPLDIQEEIQNIEVSSLLAQPEEVVEDDSLLGRN